MDRDHGPSNATTSSVGRTSAETGGSRLLHRGVTHGWLRWLRPPPRSSPSPPQEGGRGVGVPHQCSRAESQLLTIGSAIPTTPALEAEYADCPFCLRDIWYFVVDGVHHYGTHVKNNLMPCLVFFKIVCVQKGAVTYPSVAATDATLMITPLSPSSFGSLLHMAAAHFAATENVPIKLSRIMNSNESDETTRGCGREILIKKPDIELARS